MKKKLKEICTFIGGGTPSKAKAEYWNGGIPWASVKDLQGYYITETIDNISAAGLKNSSANMCEKDDLILATRIAPGRAAIAKIPVAINQDLKIVKSDMSNEWLKYFFKCKEFEILRNSGGTTVKGISLDFLGKVEVPIISLDDQIKIAAELDKIQSAIDNKKQQLALLDEAVKSKFVEMFGKNPVESGKWKVERLGNLCTITSGGTPDRKNEEYWKNGTIPWIKTTELQNNELSIVEEYITEKGLDESAAKIVPEETILLAMYGQGKTRGMTAFLKIQASTNQACACILPTESKELSQRFIWYFLIMNYENVRNLAVGCNQLNLNSSLVKNIEIQVPPLDLQNRFAAFVQKVDKAKSIAKQQIADLQELLDSKMQEYFA